MNMHGVNEIVTRPDKMELNGLSQSHVNNVRPGIGTAVVVRVHTANGTIIRSYRGR
jgi:hypothetical protein